MHPDVLQALIYGGILWACMGMWVRHRPRHGGHADLRALREEIEMLRREMADHALHVDARIEDVHERMDFTERLLTKATHADTPREHTPV